MASEGCKLDRGDDRTEREVPGRPEEPENGAGEGGVNLAPTGTPRTDSGTVMRLSTDELVFLAPRLRAYLKTPTPAWPEIVDAAD
jgi:hypothetical protein